MLSAPRIPELAQRDRFVRRAAKEGYVLTLADEEFASVPSQKTPDRTVQLFWSSAIEAKRWAEALTGDARLQDISLASFAADILPGLKAANGLAGTDWVADPIEAEIDPLDVQLRLKLESLPHMLKRLAEKGELFLVSGEGQPFIEKLDRRGGAIDAIAVFISRAEAERHLSRIRGTRVIADLAADFQKSTVPWAAERGLSIVIEQILGAGPVDIRAIDLRSRLLAA